jgi:hypothetical protein
LKKAFLNLLFRTSSLITTTLIHGSEQTDIEMTKLFKPLDLKQIQTYSVHERSSKVQQDDFAQVWQKGGSLQDFIKRLPDILAARDLIDIIQAVGEAYQKDKTVLFGMGAHVIKVGLNPVIIDLMQKGIISAIALNGAGIVHDTELALCGRTSEDVAASIDDGMFGMARETCAFLGDAIASAGRQGIGLGQAVGEAILAKDLPHKDQSLLAHSARLKIPATVHVAIGTDIIHMHPDFDPGAAGEATHKDFRTFASVVASLEGGIYFNVGSAVILPEVFLKAITLVRNLGHIVQHLTTVNMDFIRHYRPLTNVVNRPTASGGRGFTLVGHHEIMLPLLAAGIIEACSKG